MARFGFRRPVFFRSAPHLALEKSENIRIDRRRWPNLAE
jgi:hypothetical protein